MEIQFFDDPESGPKAREDVRINDIGLFVYEDGRRIAVGFNITPFRERPSIEVDVYNDEGQLAASLNVIETIEANFHLTLHLRDKEPTQYYSVEVFVYYPNLDGERMVVDSSKKRFDATMSGEQ